ncbi:hypothetical protein HAX54_033510 [Datura stramonium]|uniref:Uncharacterized protein n=1 Tax=Datura stramonium TaxID=4076 RepID=A0ABS8RM37_DATST|nr:hypothetical protein [Datura stramonium]
MGGGVKFEKMKNRSKIQVVASPLIRLTNKPNATIEDIGTPEKLLFKTPDKENASIFVFAVLQYVLEAPYALTGSHNLAKATAQRNTVVLCVVSANDNSGHHHRKTLQAIIDSFEV